MELYLKETLDSVANQTLKDIEIICVDDCSTDNTSKILQEYAQNDSRFIVIHNEHNMGLGLARNIGFDAVSGEFIMGLDADDFLEADACEILYNKIKQNQSQVLYFNFYNYNNDKKLTGINKAYTNALKNLENKGNVNVRNSYIPYIGFFYI